MSRMSCKTSHETVRETIINILIKYQLHVVSRTQQDTQNEPSVETHHSPFFAEIWKHCVLSGRNQRRAYPRHQNEEMKYKFK